MLSHFQPNLRYYLMKGQCLHRHENARNNLNYKERFVILTTRPYLELQIERVKTRTNCFASHEDPPCHFWTFSGDAAPFPVVSSKNSDQLSNSSFTKPWWVDHAYYSLLYSSTFRIPSYLECDSIRFIPESYVFNRSPSILELDLLEE